MSRRSLARLLALAFLAPGLVACNSSPTGPSSTRTQPVGGESEHYVYYFATGDTVDATWQEAYHRWATARLGVSPARKIGYHKYRSRQDMGEHTGNYQTNGYADPTRFEIHTLWSIDNHEVVHLLMSEIGQAPALFNEGIAVALQTNPATGNFDSVFNGIEVHTAARGYLASGTLVLPLDRILETTGFRSISDSTLSYREAGSFVRFLIDRYGLDRVLAFFRAGGGPNDSAAVVKTRFLATFGVTLATAEEAWLAMLRQP